MKIWTVYMEDFGDIHILGYYDSEELAIKRKKEFQVKLNKYLAETLYFKDPIVLYYATKLNEDNKLSWE